MQRYHFVIVGAGVYGCATAWWLAQSGVSVCVLDEGDVASRASGGPGRRGVRANNRDLRELPLMREAYELWPELHQRLEAEPFYTRTGQLLLAESEADAARARAIGVMQSLAGIPSEWLDAQALRELEPGLSETMSGAVYCPLDGVAAQAACTRAFAQAARRQGVEIHTGRAVSAVVCDGGTATGVRLADGEVVKATEGVLLLSNASVASLMAPWLQLPLWNACLQILVTRPLEAPVFTRLTGHLSRTVSLKTEEGGRVMISGGWRARWDAAKATGVPTPEAVAGNLAEAVTVYPALARAEVEYADAGHLESFSADGIPIIDQAPGTEGLWYAAGWCGHGWAIAPVIARHLADWAARRERPAALQAFSASRFEAGAEG